MQLYVFEDELGLEQVFTTDKLAEAYEVAHRNGWKAICQNYECTDSHLVVDYTSTEEQ